MSRSYCIHVAGKGYVRSVDAILRTVDFVQDKKKCPKMDQRTADHYQRPLAVVFPGTRVTVVPL